MRHSLANRVQGDALAKGQEPMVQVAPRVILNSRAWRGRSRWQQNSKAGSTTSLARGERLPSRGPVPSTMPRWPISSPAFMTADAPISSAEGVAEPIEEAAIHISHALIPVRLHSTCVVRFVSSTRRWLVTPSFRDGSCTRGADRRIPWEKPLRWARCSVDLGGSKLRYIGQERGADPFEFTQRVSGEAEWRHRRSFEPAPVVSPGDRSHLS
jgi:hypothetical protein